MGRGEGEFFDKIWERTVAAGGERYASRCLMPSQGSRGGGRVKSWCMINIHISVLVHDKYIYIYIYIYISWDKVFCNTSEQA